MSRSSVAAPTLGAMITKARQARNLTQRELGDLIGMGQPAVCGWERNRARPSTRTLGDLSRVLKLDLGDLTRAAGAELEHPRGSTIA